MRKGLRVVLELTSSSEEIPILKLTSQLLPLFYFLPGLIQISVDEVLLKTFKSLTLQIR